MFINWIWLLKSKYYKANWKILILFILYWHISTFDHSSLVMPTTEPPLLLVTLNHYCLVTLGLTSDIRWVTPNHWGASCLLYPTSSWVSVATAYAYILTHIYLKKLHLKKNMRDQFRALYYQHYSDMNFTLHSLSTMQVKSKFYTLFHSCFSRVHGRCKSRHLKS